MNEGLRENVNKGLYFVFVLFLFFIVRTREMRIECAQGKRVVWLPSVGKTKSGGCDVQYKVFSLDYCVRQIGTEYLRVIHGRKFRLFKCLFIAW